MVHAYATAVTAKHTPLPHVAINRPADAGPDDARGAVQGTVEGHAVGHQPRLDQLADDRPSASGSRPRWPRPRIVASTSTCQYWIGVGQHQHGHDCRLEADHDLHVHQQAARLHAVDQDPGEERQDGDGQRLGMVTSASAAGEPVRSRTSHAWAVRSSHEPVCAAAALAK